MFIGFLGILSAILISLISVYFSITGVRIIFSGAVLSVTYMMGFLELGKITATVWLYNWWKKSNKLLRIYLVLAVIILIVISSLGIFSFLTRAYSEQEMITDTLETQIERIDQQIERQKTDIERAQKGLETLDKAIERYIELDVVTRGLDKREEQKEEREEYKTIINESQNKIDELRNKKLTLQQDSEKQQVNVGPIKYIAALIYGEEQAKENYDNAARIFSLLLILVFDPFAVLLMVSGNLALDKSRRKRKKTTPIKKKTKKKFSTKKKSTKSNNKKTSKNSKTTKPKTTELPMKEKNSKEDNKVVVDMSEYLDPNEIKQLKEQTEHKRNKEV